MPPTTTVVQTNFTAGELDPALAGRVDLTAYGNGAGRLQNVVVAVTGGVSRRGGFVDIAALPGPARLTAELIRPGVRRIFALAATRLLVFENEALVASVSAPWAGSQLADLNWCHYRGGLFICHPALPPHEAAIGADGAWRVLPWQFTQRDGALTGQNVIFQPFAKYADPRTTLQAYPPSGSGAWEFRADRAVFNANHNGTRLRFRGVEVALNFVDPGGAVVRGYPQDDLPDPSRTYHWEEQGFSEAAGYPSAVAVFRERLVVGGVPKLPNRIWFSKIDEPFNFDTGQGYADEAIAFNLGQDRADAIRHFSIGRDLQVFTAGSEWLVDGQPLSPEGVFARQQTRLGCYTKRSIAPADVDGSAVLVGRNGATVEEYVFADADQGYQAENLAARAGHLIADPQDITFEPRRRLLAVVTGSGRLATATVDRNAGIVAWSEQVTAGQFLATANADGELYVVVDRADGVHLERLDDKAVLDSPISAAPASPSARLTGLGQFNGEVVQVIGSEGVIGSFTVESGAVDLPVPVASATVGRPFRVQVQAVPFSVGARGRARLYRLLQAELHLKDTSTARLDLGRGATLVPFKTVPFSGSVAVRANGWRRPDDGPVWSIDQEDPVPFTLLSATIDAKVTR